MRRIEYHPGEKVGECIYLEEITNYTSPSGHKERRALFQCRCGNTFESMITSIRYKTTISCGCIRKQNAKDRFSTHGLTSDRLYNVWRGIKKRCHSVGNKDYPRYGARGIIMFDGWRYNFKAFYDYVTKLDHYDLPGMTIDREKNDQGYIPGNIRWADKHTQNVNRRMNYNNTSGYVGVIKDRNKWRAQITRESQIYLGTFNTPEEAAEARNQYIIDNELTEYKIQ